MTRMKYSHIRRQRLSHTVLIYGQRLRHINLMRELVILRVASITGSLLIRQLYKEIHSNKKMKIGQLY